MAESVMCIIPGTQQPQRVPGCSLQFVGRPREKHVLYVSGMTMGGNKWPLWLSQHGDSKVLVLPQQWGHVAIPGPEQGGAVWALSRLLQITQLGAQCSGGTKGGRRCFLHPSIQSCGTDSGIQVPGTLQSVCSGHSRASLAMSHCATWAQTAEKQLWESADSRTTKVQSRIGLLSQECSVAQGFRRENGWVWAPAGRKAGRLVRINSKTCGSEVGQAASLSHWCGHSRWGTAALEHPEQALSVLVRKGQNTLHRCCSSEQTPAWQLIHSYLPSTGSWVGLQLLCLPSGKSPLLLQMILCSKTDSHLFCSPSGDLLTYVKPWFHMLRHEKHPLTRI